MKMRQAKGTRIALDSQRKMAALLCCAACSADPATSVDSAIAGSGGAMVQMASAGTAGDAAAAVGGFPSVVSAGGSAGTAEQAGAGPVSQAGSGGAGGESNVDEDNVAGAGGATGLGACPSNAAFCDDFETYTTLEELAPAWATTLSGGGEVSVDTTRVFGGRQALRFSGPAGGAHTEMIVIEGAPVAGNVIYGRAMLWISEIPDGAVHFNAIQSSGMLPDSTQFAKYGWGGMFGKVMAGYTIRDAAMGPTVVDCSNTAEAAFPARVWLCVEWKFDGIGNEMHLWFDGAEQSDVAVIESGNQCAMGQGPGGVWQAPTFSNLMLGWAQYQGSGSEAEMWLDDVAIGSERMGCPAPSSEALPD